jgi:cob(I)alamin adenosyltransferase
MFGSRKSKSNIVFQALGDIDETNALIGLSKAKLKKSFKDFVCSHVEFLEKTQKNLFNLMGELNCETTEDVRNYMKNFSVVTEADMHELDQWVEFLQDLPELQMKDWAIYGKSETGAILDVASKICRRAERSFVALSEEKRGLHRDLIVRYLNRLNDYLFLLARLIDFQTEV